MKINLTKLFLFIVLIILGLSLVSFIWILLIKFFLFVVLPLLAIVLLSVCIIYIAKICIDIIKKEESLRRNVVNSIGNKKQEKSFTNLDKKEKTKSRKVGKKEK